MKTKIAILFVTLVGLGWLGAGLGKWACEESRATEARWNSAVSVLGGK